MKKFFAILLTLSALVTLAACGNNNNQPTYPTGGSVVTPQPSTDPTPPAEPEPTQPKEPTREDLSNLYYYGEELERLEELAADPCPDQQTVADLYTYFTEATWVDQWDDTEYAPSKSREEILKSFVILKDVKLEESCITTDAIGNTSDPRTQAEWNYNPDGTVIDESRSGLNGIRNAYSELIYENPLCLKEIPVYSYDENGRIISCDFLGRENWNLGEKQYAAKYTYNEQGQLTVVSVTNTAGDVRDITYTYNEKGLLVEVKAPIFFNQEPPYYFKYTYGYDDQNRLIYREVLNTHDYKNPIYYKWVTEFTYEDGIVPVSADQTYVDSIYTNTYTNHWDFEYDDQNRIAKVLVTYGHEYSKTDGKLLREHHETDEITVVYGDYIAFNKG